MSRTVAPPNLGSLPHARGMRAGRSALIDWSDGGRGWTYLELDDAANAAASWLVENGYRSGDRIALVADGSAYFIIAYLGILRSGCVAVPVNHRLTGGTVAFVLSDCGAVLVFAEAVHAARLGLASWVELRAFVARALASWDSVRNFDPILPRDGVAEILYTSGSTGRPKGVVLTHEGQLWALHAIGGDESLEGERTVISAPLYHMNGLIFSTLALRTGMEMLLMPRFEARTYIQLVADQRCTRLSGIPTMLALVAREKDLLGTLDLACVRSIAIGSSPLTEALLARIRAIFPSAQVSNRYGTTEVGPAIFGVHPAGLPQPPMSVGYPMPEVECRLVGGPSDSEGVLEVRSAASFVEYLNLASETAKRKKSGWCLTGDVMRRDREGFYFFVGRDDDMFVCGGENVYPGEVEQLLESHPRVLQAAVVAVADRMKGHIPVAFIVVAPGATTTPEEIKTFCLERGPAFAHPRVVVILDRIPVAGTHKVDKRALLPLAEEAARQVGRGGNDDNSP